MQAATDPRAKELSALSSDARIVADKLESFQNTIRQEGVALALIRWREAHGERAAIVNLAGAASTLRAYAAVLESSCRVIERRVKREAAKGTPQSAGPAND